jgi:ATP-dependent DNA helicase PIF1
LSQATATAQLVQLDQHQEEVLKLVMAKKNVFFTGEAGTGKSVLLREVQVALKQEYGDKYKEKVGITATTGVAALNIGGATLHSLMGCGMPNTLYDFKKMWDCECRNRLRKLSTLIVDEISMLSAEFLDLLDRVLRKQRGVDKAFGGIQLVFCGDFYQLTPIEEDRNGPGEWAPSVMIDAGLNIH